MFDNFFWTMTKAASFCFLAFFVAIWITPDNAEMAGKFALGCYAGYLFKAFGEKA